MRKYSDFGKVFIGKSEKSSLRAVSVFNRDIAAEDISFAENGKYSAYLCIGDDILIGRRFGKVFSGKDWLKIYDDTALVFNYDIIGFYVDIYRAGDTDCIIHWHESKGECKRC